MTPPDDAIFHIATRAPLYLPLFALVLLRVSGLVMTAPLFGSQTIPIRVRAMLAVALTVAVFPMAAPHLPRTVDFAQVLPGAAGELMIGLVVGLGLTVALSSVELAGMVIGQQGGLSLGQVFNPALNEETTLIGQVYSLTAIVVFISAGGHREMLRAVLDTYEVIPVLSFDAGPPMTALFADLLNSAYIVALRLAAPVVLALMIATLAMGFLSRTMPQLNILSVGFMIRAMLTMGLAGMTLAASGSLIESSMGEAIERIRGALGLG